MPEVSFFNAFGLLGVPDFLEPSACQELRREIEQASISAATVREEGSEYGVDEGRRKTRWAEVSSEASALVTARLDELRPRIAATFGFEPSGLQPPQFLVYREGDFFRRHSDSNRDEGAAQFARERRVSAIVFLNGESAEPSPDAYGGGALTLYGLMDDGRGGAIGLPATAQTGALLAFPSELVHEVTPVTHGERYTVVSWFY